MQTARAKASAFSAQTFASQFGIDCYSRGEGGGASGGGEGGREGESGALRIERPLKGPLPSSETKSCEIFRDPTPSGFILGRESRHISLLVNSSPRKRNFYIMARALVSIRVRSEERSNAVKTSCL